MERAEEGWAEEGGVEEGRQGGGEKGGGEKGGGGKDGGESSESDGDADALLRLEMNIFVLKKRGK